jgi:hypothetical protein
MKIVHEIIPDIVLKFYNYSHFKNLFMMKKLLLICVALLLTGTTLLGQTTLFTESFENGGAIPAGWSNTIITSGSLVSFLTSGSTGYPAVTVTPYDGTYEVYYNAYSISSGGSTQLARTVNTSTVGYSSITVDFAMYHDNGYNPSTGEGIQPQYSIDNGVNWIAAGAFINRYSASNGWVVHTISLPANAAGIANLRISFLFVSQFGNNVFMDFVHIKGTAAPVVLLGEGWELATNNSNVPPPNWGIDLLGYTNITYYMSSGTYPTVAPYEGSRLVDFESYSYGTNTTNRLKRTTPISTVGYTAINVDFAWYTDPGYAGTTTEGVIIQWSTDGSTWNSAGTTWMRYSATAQWVINTQNLPVGAENQPTLYIAFLFNSNFGNDCHMDIIHVKGTGAALPPTVTTTAATNVLSTTATLNGTVNANGTSTAVTFQYGLTTAYGSTVAGVPSPVTGNSATPVLANITGLTANTLYHYRCVGAATNGNDMTFTTTLPPPTVVTTAATNILVNTATLNGTVNANGSSTTVSFDYGLTAAYGSNVAGVPSPVTGSSAVAVSANIAGLTPGTLYHFRVKGVNVGGTTNGGDLTFTTSAQPPTVVTLAATGVGGTNATLNGTINPNSAPTTSGFDYGLTIPYGSSAAGVPLNLSGNTVQAVNAALSGLTNNSVYHFRVKGTNAGGTTYGNDLTFVLGCPSAGAAGALSGPTTVCAGGNGYVYTVPVIQGATGYVWNLPIGAAIVSGSNTNSITVNYAYNSAPGYMMVYGTAPCGNGPPSQIAVAVNQPPTPTISGPASVCVNSTGNTYTTQAGMTGYAWTVSAGGTVTGGGTGSSNTVTVTWNTVGPQTVSVNYNNANGCAGLNPVVFNITVNALPVPIISGPANACTNTPAVYTTQAAMTGYTWTTSAGGTISGGGGTNSVTVNWTGTGAQTVSVNYTNAAGCTAAAPVSYPVTVNATTVPIITGSGNVCVNSGYYTYTTQAGMTGYTWTISPGGTINSGGGTNALTVSWTTSGAQWVSVNFTNPTGCTPATPTQYNVTVNSLPGAAGSITGTSTLCAGTTGVAYSVGTVPNAVAYVWTLPAGATIASGANSNSITVDFAGNASGGNITVAANNICGNGTVSPPFAVTVNPLPATPVVTNTGYTVYSSAPAGNQWYHDGAMIVGATDQSYDCTLSGTGNYWSIVTLNGCSSVESNHQYVVVTGIDPHSSQSINLYPIPNDGRFNVSITASNEIFSISVYNNLGVKIYEETKVEVNGTLQKVIDLRPIPNGVYSVIFENSQNQVVKKIIVNK